VRRLALAFLGVAAALFGSGSHAGLSPPPVHVYFTNGEDVMHYARAGAPRTLKGALRALLRGPTNAERRDDVRTWIPHGTRLISVHRRGHVVTVDLGRRFLRGSSSDSLRARVVEVVYTATQFRHEHRVRLLVNRRPVRLEDGVAPSRFLTRHDVDPPKRALLTPTSYVKDRQGPDTGKTKRLQSKLIELGYLPEGSATGRYGPQTTQAVMAFQGWEGLDRDGDAGPKTYKALRTATRPEPKAGTGKRALVYLKRQVLLLARGSRTVRAIHVSSGAPGTSTPPGRFRIYRKARKDWSYPFKVWLQYASYFTGGIAFHEYPDVPPYPASHGCVRVPRDDSKTVYEFTKLGTPVSVLRS
jgi:L,D-transpeptidase catalytic domain/Putative peptidoglycan binding domain/Sporulation and spore germination